MPPARIPRRPGELWVTTSRCRQFEIKHVHIDMRLDIKWTETRHNSIIPANKMYYWAYTLYACFKCMQIHVKVYKYINERGREGERESGREGEWEIGRKEGPWLLLPHALDDGRQDLVGLHSQHIRFLRQQRHAHIHSNATTCTIYTHTHTHKTTEGISK